MCYLNSILLHWSITNIIYLTTFVYILVLLSRTTILGVTKTVCKGKAMKYKYINIMEPNSRRDIFCVVYSESRQLNT